MVNCVGWLASEPRDCLALSEPLFKNILNLNLGPSVYPWSHHRGPIPQIYMKDSKDLDHVTVGEQPSTILMKEFIIEDYHLYLVKIFNNRPTHEAQISKIGF